MNTTKSIQDIEALITETIEVKTTAELLDMHAILDAITSPTQQDRLMGATVADAITHRLNLDDIIEDIMFGDDENIYEGTYHEAILAAMARVAA